MNGYCYAPPSDAVRLALKQSHNVGVSSFRLAAGCGPDAESAGAGHQAWFPAKTANRS